MNKYSQNYIQKSKLLHLKVYLVLSLWGLTLTKVINQYTVYEVTKIINIVNNNRFGDLYYQ